MIDVKLSPLKESHILGNAAGLPLLHRNYTSSPVNCHLSTIRKSEDDDRSFVLEVRLLWKDSVLISGRLNEKASLTLSLFLGSPVRRFRDTQSWKPSDFYDNVHIPPESPQLESRIHSALARVELLPFQRRAVRWLLEREGMEALPGGDVRPLKLESGKELPDSFVKVEDADSQECFVSPLFGVVTSDISQWPFTHRAVKGGLLAEEMGLGKTVEMIMLICLNRQNDAPIYRRWPNLTESGSTLIITPPAILKQWRQEIATHAPSLRCVYYEGLNRTLADNDTLIRELATSDVVLTTYNVLRTEVHYAEDPPHRSMRYEKRIPQRKSPLVQISWWRVCIDEAQMVESGVSNAARVAIRVPRQNSWAVTGTPLRKDIRDLHGILSFIRYEPYSSAPETLIRLYNDFKTEFRSLIGTIALRHNKNLVRDELQLPHQKRIVITIPFTAVEEQHYNQTFEMMCSECGFDTNGSPLEGYDPNSGFVIEKMRRWLTRLRQIVLHPELGGSGRRALGSSAGTLRNVSEVLEAMIDQNDVQIRTEERSLLMSQTLRGQLLENAGRQEEALKLWKGALLRAQSVVKDCRVQLSSEKYRVSHSADDNSSTDDVSDTGMENEGETKKGRVGTYRQRLRAALEVEHICKFFIANAYFQIKTNPELTKADSEEYHTLENLEEKTYEEAKQIRKEMLADTNHRVSRHIDSLRTRADKKGLVDIPEMTPYIEYTGLESRRILDKVEDICELLNKQANQYRRWRDHMVKLLLESLIDEEDGAELEGNEYESSTKHQDEMYVYMEALRVLQAYRNDAITGQTNLLIAHEVRQGLTSAKADEGPSPQLYIKLMNTCKDLKSSHDLGSLRGIIGELRSLVVSLEWQESRGSSRSRAELAIADKILKDVGSMSSAQSKCMSSLERENETFRSVMNQRLEYYKQLQTISDTVAPYDEESKGKPLNVELFREKLETENNLDAKISALRSKHRYLIHLRDESTETEEARTCVICQSSFEIGML